MDFRDRTARGLVRKAIGEELRRARERRGWSRAEFVARLPSGIGERTLLAYEHGLRELSVLRLLELCTGLKIEPTDTVRLSLQTAGVLLDNLALRIDLRALLTNMRPKFRPMHQWARNKLNSCTDGMTELAPVAVRELADFIGCSHDELATYLARFTPDEDAAEIQNKQKIVTKLVDDLDGTHSQDVSTVLFDLDGASYEIDLSDANAQRLRDGVATFVNSARRTGA